MRDGINNIEILDQLGGHSMFAVQLVDSFRQQWILQRTA